MSKGSARASNGFPAALLCAEAAILVTAYGVGVGRIEAPISVLLRGTPRGYLLAAFAELAVVVGVVYLLNGLRLHRRGAGPARADRRFVATRCSEAILLLGVMALALRFLVPGLDASEFARRGLGAPGALLRFAWTLPFGVLAEEVVFRASQDRLRRCLGGWPTLVTIPVLFAFYHSTPGRTASSLDLALLASLAAGGWIISRLYEATGSLAAAVGVHLAYDFLAVGQAWLNVFRGRAIEAAYFAVWLVGSAALAFAGARRALKLTRVAGEADRHGGHGRTWPEIIPAPAWARWAIALVLAVGLPVLLSRIRSGG
ncbi:MAG: CPBP family intramembrane metalloprotease [Acidobacteriia bacterium]|nr:CPBP family intramembrane metalloprotease [Terriglobia bacterium]